MGRTRSEWLHWYRADTDLESHPRLLELAEILKLDTERAVGRMHRFWSWMCRHAPRGVLPPGWDAGVRRLFGQGFPDALRRVGWVEQTEEGDKFRHWWEMNGHLLRERERKRRGDSAEPAGVSEPPRVEAASTATSTRKDSPVLLNGRCSAAAVANAKRLYPTRDVDLIETKLLEYHERRPYKSLDRALLNWCARAQRGNTESLADRNGHDAPADEDASMARMRKLLAEKEAKSAAVA